MNRKSVLAIGIATVWFAALGRLGRCRAGQVHRKGAGRARILRVQGYEAWQTISHQPEREGGCGDSRQSRDDRRLPGRHSRQRQACPRRRQDGEGALDPETEPVLPGCDRAGQLLNVDFMVKDSKRFADSGGWGYAVFDYDAASIRSRPAPLPARRRRGTTPSAGSRAIPGRRREITCLRSTGKR